MRNAIIKNRLKKSVKLKLFKLASTIAKSSLMPLLSGFTIKTEYNLSEEDSNSSNSPTMVETTSPLLKARAISPSPRLSPQSHNFLASKMLLTQHNLSYLEQKFHQRNSSANGNYSDHKNSENMCKNGTTSSSSNASLFTIDSILSKQSRSIVERSPSSSPISDNLFSKTDSISPTRLPPAALFQHHAAAGLHITHLASNFGSPEFLGTHNKIIQDLIYLHSL